jgi:hypothetical protein
MYHTFTLWSITIALTGIWVIFFIVTFLRIVHRESYTYESINFDGFFKYSPMIVILTYLLASRWWYFINELVILPTSSEQILLYLSPVWRKFSLLGIIAWIGLSVWSFLKKQPQKDRIIRIDIFFKATCRSLIPLWIFLVLWDSFIGLPTQSSIWVSAIKVDSALGLYNKVLPIWIGISIIGILWVTAESLFKKYLHQWHWYAGIGLILIGFAYITIYQNYARRILSSLWDTRLDVKQYVLVIIALGFLYVWWRHRRRSIS